MRLQYSEIVPWTQGKRAFRICKAAINTQYNLAHFLESHQKKLRLEPGEQEFLSRGMYVRPPPTCKQMSILSAVVGTHCPISPNICMPMQSFSFPKNPSL